MRVTIVALLSLLVGLAIARDRPAKPSAFSPEHREIFYAVLEGLYEDGVSDEVVDRILKVTPGTTQPMHFVYGCPICDPALDAFRAYRARGEWHYKNAGNTFGPGLNRETRAALGSEKFADRFQAVQRLIKRWVGARLDKLRLTKDERVQWNGKIEALAQKGNALLESMRTAGTAGGLGEMKACAICNGAVEGSRGG